MYAGIERAKVAERKDIQAQYREQGRGPDGSLSMPLSQVESWHVKSYLKTGDLRGQQLVRRIKELKAGQSQYVFDQINRAKRTTIRDGLAL